PAFGAASYSARPPALPPQCIRDRTACCGVAGPQSLYSPKLPQGTLVIMVDPAVVIGQRETRSREIGVQHQCTAQSCPRLGEWTFGWVEIIDVDDEVDRREISPGQREGRVEGDGLPE